MVPKIHPITCGVILSLAIVCGAKGEGDKGPAGGAPPPDDRELKSLQEDNARLHSQIETLESELTEIQKALGRRGEATTTAAAEPKPTAPAQLTEPEITQLKKLAATNKKPVLSSVDLEFYGYVKADASHDSSRASVGNYARWVESEQLVKDHDQFSLTAKQTRLGVKATGPALGKMQSSALVEIDFYGGGDAENKPVPMMRHAYLNLDWPEDRFSILAGQTYDVISPLWMPTLNYTVGWWQGDIGYRRPQIRLTKGFEPAKDVLFKLEAAATRDIGRANDFTESYSDSGQDSSIPGLQGRASLTLPGFNSKPTTIGVSGHWAEEQINHTNTFANPTTIDSWSVNLDLTVPITTWLSLTGEAFSGQDLDAYLGGIGQGYDATRNKAIRSDGGWATLTLKPAPKLQFNVGGGFDKVPKGDVTPATARTFNSVIYGNVQYAFTANFTLGYEMSYLRTEYKAEKDGEDLREQLSFIYKF